jgi:hypothetical protein
MQKHYHMRNVSVVRGHHDIMCVAVIDYKLMKFVNESATALMDL